MGVFKRWATTYVVKLLQEGMAVRHMGEQKATHGKNRLHEVFLGGSKLAFIISNFKSVCEYRGGECLYVYVYNILSYSGFYRRHHKLESRGLEVWGRRSGNLEVG